MREMKDSGIEWIGEIPSDWIINRIKFVADLFNGDRGKNYPSGDDLVDDGIVFLSSNNIHDVVLDVSPEKSKYITNEHYKLLAGAKIKINDIIYCLRGSVGLCAINQSASEGTIASSLLDIRPKNVSPKFLNYYLQSPANTIQTLMNMNGSCASNLSAENVANYYLIEPPINEQNKIANYLDQKCSEIDAITKDIQTQIDTLEQYKRSVITEAVTKGLDPDVEMKDSGIEWIGKIPKNWKTAKLKYAIGMLTDYTANGSFADLAKNVEYHDFEDHARLIRLTDLRENLNNPGVYVNNEAYNYLSKSKLFGGEVLVANVGAYAGLFCEMPVIDRPATLGPNMFLIRANSNITNHFLFYIGNSFIVCEQLSQKAFSAAQPKLNKTDVKTIHLIIPPKEEQQIITTFLDNKCSEVDILIKDKQQQLSTLSDYKKSLIYEYATGKKEVPAQ